MGCGVVDERQSYRAWELAEYNDADSLRASLVVCDSILSGRAPEETIAKTHARRGYAFWRLGELTGSTHYYELSVEAYQTGAKHFHALDRELMLRTFGHMAAAAKDAGRSREAVEMLDGAVSLARIYGENGTAAFLLRCQADIVEGLEGATESATAPQGAATVDIFLFFVIWFVWWCIKRLWRMRITTIPAH